MSDLDRSVLQFAERLEARSLVLDIGCGLRPYESAFSGCAYVGIDVIDSGRRPEDKRPDVLFDGHEIPFPTGTMDAVICTEVLEHALDPDALLAEACRVLKVGGLAFVTVPFMWGEHEAPYDFRRYSTFGVRQLFTRTALHITEMTRLTEGADAIAALVSSEINNYVVHVRRRNPTLIERLLESTADRLWRLQRRLWSRLYRFERVFLNVAVIAVKEREY